MNLCDETIYTQAHLYDLRMQTVFTLIQQSRTLVVFLFNLNIDKNH